jgi:hypothetical protein
MMQRHNSPMASYRFYPAKLLTGLRHRLPNPIEATISGTNDNVDCTGLQVELPSQMVEQLNQIGHGMSATSSMPTHQVGDVCAATAS